MKFEWDPSKASENFKKNRISFDEAMTVFFDPLAKVASDPEHSSDEDRFVIVGQSTQLRHLIDDGIIRIISARKLTKKEMKEFKEIK